MPSTQRFVAYYRVSTTGQARSGLGLEDQRGKLQTFLARGGGELVAEFTEHESAWRSARQTLAKRPMLRDAIALCREAHATLLVATIHRLSRSFAFIAALMESDVEFAAVDMPGVDRFMLHIHAALAEQESRMISERKRAATGAAKRRGDILSQHLKPFRDEQHREAQRQAETLRPLVNEIRREHGSKRMTMLRELAARGIPTVNGGPWTYSAVRNLLFRLDGDPPDWWHVRGRWRPRAS
jgi:DNA invertase Pin-like site-specific DNA recombinase